MANRQLTYCVMIRWRNCETQQTHRWTTQIHFCNHTQMERRHLSSSAAYVLFLGGKKSQLMKYMHSCLTAVHFEIPEISNCRPPE